MKRLEIYQHQVRRLEKILPTKHNYNKYVALRCKLNNELDMFIRFLELHKKRALLN